MDGLVASCTKGRLTQMGLSCAAFKSCQWDLLCVGCICIVSWKLSKAGLGGAKWKRK